MNELNAIDQLALQAGIQPGYHDARGIYQQTGSATKEQLLAAMGILPAGMEPAAVLEERLRRAWGRLLTTVMVTERRNRRLVIPLSLTDEELTRRLDYYLALEDGESVSGHAAAGQLEETEQREIMGRRYHRLNFELREKITGGYHRLTVNTGKREATMLLIVCPPTCYVPASLTAKQRCWGLAADLCQLRSPRNWGIGDFTDLEQLINLSADCGADLVGLSPLHMLLEQVTGPRSPSPANRRFPDMLFLDPTRVAEYREEHFQDEDFRRRLAACREGEGIDFAKIASLKREVLAHLYHDFRKYQLEKNTARANSFRLFQAARGRLLHEQALFSALEEHFSAVDPSLSSWRQWPAPYRQPASSAVKRFAAEHREQLVFHEYLIWQSELQLAACGNTSMARHLAVGLCLELAPGVHPDGAEAWLNQELYAKGASIGSPPDRAAPEGRKGELLPPIPERLAEAGYAPLTALLRASMQYAGALQVRESQQFMRLFWVPDGGPAADGAYVHYPLQDLLALIALESRRNRCLVIAADLAGAPEMLTAALEEKRIFSSQPLFPRPKPDALLKRPDQYPAASLVTMRSQQSATLADYWEGNDLEAERPAGALDEKYEQALQKRHDERAGLLTALEQEQLLPPDTGQGGREPGPMSDALNRALHRYLARSPALLFLAQLEDIFGLREAGLSGPSPTRSRLRRRLPVTLEELPGSPPFSDMLAAIQGERQRQTTPAERERRKPRPVIIPRATYRLQLGHDFTFDQAAAILPYLAALGVSHCYTSPCFEARSGSSHGYDVVDPNRFSREIGGMDGFLRFHRALKDNGLAQILDIVPNHMGVMGSDNSWWLDVLENGESSLYTPFFDIDWQPVKKELRHKLLVPVLGEPYGAALEQGHLKLALDAAAGTFQVSYHHHCFPLDPRTYPLILNRRLDILEIRLGPEHPQLLELLSLITAFSQLPPHTAPDPKSAQVRRRDKEICKQRLARLAAESPDIQRHLEETVAEFNTHPTDASRLQGLHQLLEAQVFRLAYWRVAADEINYRRFFDINDLAALCVENEQVFETTHRLILKLVRQGMVDGLRIDHPDGLYDPAAYYRQLVGRLQPVAAASAAPPVYLVVEKILAPHEHLPHEWPVHGTTGYDFANLAGGLFIDRRSARKLTTIFRRFTSVREDFERVLLASKKRIMRQELAGELNVLANRLDRLSELDWQSRDFTLNSLRAALAEITAAFPVYRTYVTEREATPQDRNFINWAVAQAKKNTPAADHTIFDYIRSILLLEPQPRLDHEYRRAAVDFAMRFQQFTAPVMAKGMEDTAFYIYNRLISLNEVGGDPRRFGVSIAAFHRLCRDRADNWPHTMLTTSTHDSKRSEDVRCRLAVLTEIPDQWQARVNGWRKINRPLRSQIDGEPAPSAGDEYLLYQTLLGFWPLGQVDEAGLAGLRKRLEDYMIKACREAKMHTSWVEPNRQYELAVSSFVANLLASPESHFLTDFLPFHRLVARLGLYNSLSQCLLKLTAPGVPDIYQGCELWDFHLVDPDNRQPVDYPRRSAMLAGLQEEAAAAGGSQEGLAAQLLASLEDSRLKLFIIWKLLHFRKSNEELFQKGAYLPLAVEGSRADQLCAFARRTAGGRWVVAAAARFYVQLTAMGEREPIDTVWADTLLELPADLGGVWRDIFTGATISCQGEMERRTLRAAEVFRHLPVALLLYQGD